MGGVVDVESPRENEEHAAFKRPTTPNTGGIQSAAGRSSDERAGDINENAVPRSRGKDQSDTTGQRSTSRQEAANPLTELQQLLSAEREARESTERAMQHRYLQDQQEFEKRARDLLSLLQDGLSQERVARESACGRFEQSLSSEQSAHQQQQAEWRRRLEHVEGVAKETEEQLRTLREGFAQEKIRQGDRTATLDSRLEVSDQSLRGLHTRVDFLQQNAQETADKALGTLQSTSQSLSDRMGEIYASLEVDRNALKDLDQRLVQLEESNVVNERLNSVEKLVIESDSKHEQHVRSLEAANARVNDLHTSFSEDQAAKQQNKVALEERLNLLEKFSSDAAAKHEQHVQALEIAHARIHNVEANHTAERSDSVAKHEQYVKALEAAHAMAGELHASNSSEQAAIQERLNSLEASSRDSASNHEQHLKSLEAAHARINDLHASSSSESAAKGAFHERLNVLEKIASESTANHEQHVKAVEAANARLNDLHAKYSTEQSDYNAAVQKRLDSLESFSRDSTTNHDRSLKALEDTDARITELQGYHSATNVAREQHNSSVQARLDALEAQVGDVREQYNSSGQARLDALEAQVGDIQQRVQLLDGTTQQGRSSTQERLELLTKTSQDVAAITNSHVASILNMQGQLDSLAKKADDDSAARQRLAALDTEFRQSVESHKQALDVMRESHSTGNERLDSLEKSVHESCFEHEKHMQALDYLHGRFGAEVESRQQQHAELHQRVDSLMAQMPASTGSQEPAANNQRLDTLEHSVAESLNRTELSCAAFQDRFDSLEKVSADFREKLCAESESRQQQSSVMLERLDFVEKQIGESAALHEQHLKTLEAADAKIVDFCNNMSAHRQAREVHHATLSERLERIEKHMGDTADQYPPAGTTPPSTTDRLSAELFAAFGKREKSGGRCCGP